MFDTLRMDDTEYIIQCDAGRRLAYSLAELGNVAAFPHEARRMLNDQGFGGALIGFLTALGEMAVEDARSRF